MRIPSKYKALRECRNTLRVDFKRLLEATEKAVYNTHCLGVAVYART